MPGEQDNLARQLADALRTIEQQAALIERLLARQADSGFADELRDILLTTSTAGSIGSRVTHSAALDHVVETAADVLDAQEASLFLVDEQHEELVFVVALESKAEEVKQFRVPLGHGIAGYSASTGQPIAVADVESDPRFVRDIGGAIGYVPKTILCVPLLHDDRVIGVLELMDKADGVPFSTTDMETSGYFAKLAALTIDETRLTHDMRRLFRSILSDVVQGDSIGEAALRFADRTAEYAGNADTIRLAGLVHEISRQGEAARRMVIEVLTSLRACGQSKFKWV